MLFHSFKLSVVPWRLLGKVSIPQSWIYMLCPLDPSCIGFAYLLLHSSFQLNKNIFMPLWFGVLLLCLPLSFFPMCFWLQLSFHHINPVYQFANPGITKYHRLGCLNNRHLCSHSAGTCKSRVRMHQVWFLWDLCPWLNVLTWPVLRACSILVSASSWKNTGHIGTGLPSASF